MSTSHRLILSLAGMLLGASALAVQPPEPPLPPAPPAPPSKQVSISEGAGEGYALVDGSRDNVTMSGNDVDSQQIKQLQQTVKGQFLWFRDQGKSYTLQEPALLARVNAAWKPSQQLGEQMGRLGKQMGVHGKAMGELGSKMGRHSQGQAGARDAAQLKALVRQQEDLGRKLGDAARRQAQANTDAARRAAERDVARLQQQMEDAQDATEEVNDRIAAAHERDADKVEALSRQMDERGKPMETLGKQMSELGRQQETAARAADKTTRLVIAQALSEGKARALH